MDIAPGESPIGEVIQESGPDGIIYNAFIPHPLPSSPIIGIGAYEAATQAAMAVARLDQALSQLPRAFPLGKTNYKERGSEHVCPRGNLCRTRRSAGS